MRDSDRRVKERLKDNIGEIVSPPYTEAELEQMREELDETWMPMIRKNEDIVKAATEEHQDRWIIATMLGISFMTICFLLQIVGAIKA